MKSLVHLAMFLSAVSSLFADSGGPLTLREALAAFRLEPGLKIELVAAEPLVVDPVAMAFDEMGRLYVVENRGYPTGPGEGKPPAGIIALLEDTNHDGRFDKRTVFADALTFPNGILPWRGGVIVTCAPDILYFKDTDGDGRADERRVVLTGFDASNTTQLRVSHPTLGPDNWIYVTSGLTGGKVVRPGSSNAAPVETRTDVRFRPDTWEFEPCDGRGQFGLTFDDFGHRFVCMNRVQVQHVVLSSRSLRRNPALNFSETVQNVPETMVPEPLPGHLSAARIYPISHNITTADSHAGTFTAACGVMIFRGTALPLDYYENVFSCDPTGNLVHRDKLDSFGATFSASRITNEIEMVASTDDWFRPVFLTQGPDGALYICDMYRKTIEHPQYLPGDVRKHTDFESGKDKGRIYRVVATNSAASSRQSDFSHASVEDLCKLMNHPNGWQRDTAHRLLLEKGNPEMAGPLKQFIRSESASSPPGRVLALNLLEHLSALDEATILRALDDFHPGVRETAVTLAASRLHSSSSLVEEILAAASDADSHVRFQCALALGEVPSEPATEALAQLAVGSAEDKWTRAAVLSSIGSRELAFARFCTVLLPRSTTPRITPAGPTLLSQEIGRLLGASLPTNDFRNVLSDLLTRPVPTLVLPWHLCFLSGFLAALDTRGLEFDIDLLPQQVQPGRETMAISRAKAIEQRALAILTDKTASIELRQAAVDVVARFPVLNRNPLLQLLEPQQPTALQATTVRAIARSKDQAEAAKLLETDRWNRFTPAVREAILDSMLSNPRRVPTLLTAIESGGLSAGVVNSVRRKQLLQHRDEAIRQRASALFKNPGPTDRMKVFEDYKSVLSLTCVPANGREVFKRNCSSCHRLDREGVPVGPDLFSIRNQSKETILLHIIVPEYEILPGFVNYLVETKDGRSLSGVIAAETPQAVTLRKALAEEETIGRSNIVSMTSSGLSMMPQELEKTMTRQEIADLLAYLKGE